MGRYEADIRRGATKIYQTSRQRLTHTQCTMPDNVISARAMSVRLASSLAGTKLHSPHQRRAPNTSRLMCKFAGAMPTKC